MNRQEQDEQDRAQLHAMLEEMNKEAEPMLAALLAEVEKSRPELEAMLRESTRDLDQLLAQLSQESI